MFFQPRQYSAGRAAICSSSIIVGLILLVLLTACDAPNVAPLTPTPRLRSPILLVATPNAPVAPQATNTPTIVPTPRQNATGTAPKLLVLPLNYSRAMREGGKLVRWAELRK